MVPFNLKVLAKVGHCSNCSQKLGKWSLARARKTFCHCSHARIPGTPVTYFNDGGSYFIPQKIPTFLAYLKKSLSVFASANFIIAWSAGNYFSNRLQSQKYINNSLHLARKYARIFVRGHYLFRVANSFPRA